MAKIERNKNTKKTEKKTLKTQTSQTGTVNLPSQRLGMTSSTLASKDEEKGRHDPEVRLPDFQSQGCGFEFYQASH